MRVLVGPALAAFMLVQLCGADMPHTIHRAHSMEGFLAQQHQQGAGSGLAYVEPMALVNGGRLARGQSAAPAASRRCARPIGEVHVSGRPAPSLSSLQHMANTRWAVRQDVSLRRAGQVTMQADASFDPLGLASGMSTDIDVDTAIVQKQLWEAAKAGDIEGIELAIKGGADVNYKYPEEGNAAAMQSAALNGQAQAVVKLAEMGGDVNGCDKFGWTPLHDASLNGHQDVIAKLVELGADVNAQTSLDEDEAPGSGGRTPLTNAAMNGHTKTVDQLVTLGADVTIKIKDGWTALHLAAKNGWEETVEKLVLIGIDVNAKNDVDMTALHYAAWDSTVETVQKLIDLGVDVTHKAKGKLSALDLAEKRSKERAGRAILKLLQQASGLEEKGNMEKVVDEYAVKEDHDSEWGRLINNDPYAKSSDGLNF